MHKRRKRKDSAYTSLPRYCLCVCMTKETQMLICMYVCMYVCRKAVAHTHAQHLPPRPKPRLHRMCLHSWRQSTQRCPRLIGHPPRRYFDFVIPLCYLFNSLLLFCFAFACIRFLTSHRTDKRPGSQGTHSRRRLHHCTKESKEGEKGKRGSRVAFSPYCMCVCVLTQATQSNKSNHNCETV